MRQSHTGVLERNTTLTGEFATVLFNVYDDEDNLIVSEEQVEELVARERVETARGLVEDE